MKAIKTVLLFTLVTSSCLASLSGHAQFRTRYYPLCYQALEEARAMVPVPPKDLSDTMATTGKVANVASKLGGFGGFGGFGGGAAKAVQTVQTVNQYSGLIADVAAFTAAMQDEFPDLGLRLGAYGERLGEDADLLVDAGNRITQAQDCYREAYIALILAYESEQLKRREVNRQHGEIEKGLAFADEILADARVRVNKNIESYNDALSRETTNAGIDLGALASLAGSAGVMNKVSASLAPDTLSACRNVSAFAPAAAGCAQLTGAGGAVSGDLCPSGNCSLSEMRARGSRQQLTAIANGEPRETPSYGVMEELSAIGMMGAGPAGAAGAAALLGGEILEGPGNGNGDAAAVTIDDDVLQGLVEAGAMSSRYLVVKQGLDDALAKQLELAEHTRKSPAAR